eukprot:TRINITY_DN11091_c0_g1_i1.p1 TRINITY_DN11091_c0_g1~~TRINITY_DN11091_c0_g1_i1.p1  ORF type:complete len:232 (-),score=79.39 TRINITY_DN11091_c0_g1_i1:135-830(-)
MAEMFQGLLGAASSGSEKKSSPRKSEADADANIDTGYLAGGFQAMRSFVEQATSSGSNRKEKEKDKERRNRSSSSSSSKSSASADVGQHSTDPEWLQAIKAAQQEEKKEKKSKHEQKDKKDKTEKQEKSEKEQGKEAPPEGKHMLPVQAPGEGDKPDEDAAKELDMDQKKQIRDALELDTTEDALPSEEWEVKMLKASVTKNIDLCRRCNVPANGSNIVMIQRVIEWYRGN